MPSIAKTLLLVSGLVAFAVAKSQSNDVEFNSANLGEEDSFNNVEDTAAELS